MILDIEKLEKRIKKVVSTEESLKDVEPFCWDDEVLPGQKASHGKAEKAGVESVSKNQLL